MTTKEEYANEKKEFLKKYLKPGDRIFFVERHKTSNNKWFDVYMFYSDPFVDGGSVRSWRLTSLVAIVCDRVYDHDREALKVTNDGYTSDMYVASELGRVLFGDSKALKYETLR